MGEVRRRSVDRTKLVQRILRMISQIKDRLKAARDRQKSYADKRTKPLEFSVGDHVLLKVSPWKGVVCFGKKGKLAPRFVGPFEIIEKVGPVAYSRRCRISQLRRLESWERDMGQSGVGNSYVQVVKGNNTSVVAESDHTPTLVLDDECLNTSDLSNSLMGRVKEFASLSNLKMMKMLSLEKTVHKDEGWVPDFLEESDDEHDSDDDVNEGDLNAVDSDVDEGQKEKYSKDPFNIYELLNKKKDNVESEDKSEHSPQYPPGYTPKDGIETFCNNGGELQKMGRIFTRWSEEGGADMGYNMDGCMNNMTEIIESQGVKEGEVIIMGDFNEVRCKSERFGSNFNVQGANVFNSFIVNAGLEEIPLATSLERYLSDHRPILLRESHFDYGPTPFRFFHSWFEMEGFNKLVEDCLE
ncbi:RNA-directed DNA polymerase, eukaryota [Tanacetum coccineum]